MELAPAPPFTGDGEIGDKGDADDDQSEQSLGEHGQSKQRVYCVPVQARFWTVKRGDHAIECGRDEEAENSLRNEYAGEEKISNAGGNEESGIESGTRTEGATVPSPMPSSTSRNMAVTVGRRAATSLTPKTR